MDFLTRLQQTFTLALGAPFEIFSDPSERMHWIYLISAAVMVIAFYIFGHNRRDWKKDLRWSHASFFLDLKIIAFNWLFRIFWGAVGLVSIFAITLQVQKSLWAIFGEIHYFVWPPVLLALTFTLVSFVFSDFVRFFVHYLMHKIPFLWEFHKVHHSALTLTPLTLYRMHPLEIVLGFFRRVAGTGLVAGVFAYLFGPAINGYDILGVNVLAFLFTLAGSNLRHSPFPISFGWLENWILSPAQHQIHHSADRILAGRNLGTCLALWDRMFGTFQRYSPDLQIEFGLGAHGLPQTLRGHLWVPIQNVFNMALSPMRAKVRKPLNQPTPIPMNHFTIIEGGIREKSR